MYCSITKFITRETSAMEGEGVETQVPLARRGRLAFQASYVSDGVDFTLRLKQVAGFVADGLTVHVSVASLYKELVSRELRFAEHKIRTFGIYDFAEDSYDNWGRREENPSVRAVLRIFWVKPERLGMGEGGRVGEEEKPCNDHGAMDDSSTLLSDEEELEEEEEEGWAPDRPDTPYRPPDQESFQASPDMTLPPKSPPPSAALTPIIKAVSLGDDWVEPLDEKDESEYEEDSDLPPEADSDSSSGSSEDEELRVWAGKERLTVERRGAFGGLSDQLGYLVFKSSFASPQGLHFGDQLTGGQVRALVAYANAAEEERPQLLRRDPFLYFQLQQKLGMEGLGEELAKAFVRGAEELWRKAGSGEALTDLLCRFAPLAVVQPVEAAMVEWALRLRAEAAGCVRGIDEDFDIVVASGEVAEFSPLASVSTAQLKALGMEAPTVAAAVVEARRRATAENRFAPEEVVSLEVRVVGAGEEVGRVGERELCLASPVLESLIRDGFLRLDDHTPRSSLRVLVELLNGGSPACLQQMDDLLDMAERLDVAKVRDFALEEVKRLIDRVIGAACDSSIETVQLLDAFRREGLSRPSEVCIAEMRKTSQPHGDRLLDVRDAWGWVWETAPPASPAQQVEAGKRKWESPPQAQSGGSPAPRPCAKRPPPTPPPAGPAQPPTTSDRLPPTTAQTEEVAVWLGPSSSLSVERAALAGASAALAELLSGDPPPGGFRLLQEAVYEKSMKRAVTHLATKCPEQVAGYILQEFMSDSQAPMALLQLALRWGVEAVAEAVELCLGKSLCGPLDKAKLAQRYVQAAPNATLLAAHGSTNLMTLMLGLRTELVELSQEALTRKEREKAQAGELSLRQRFRPRLCLSTQQQSLLLNAHPELHADGLTAHRFHGIYAPKKGDAESSSPHYGRNRLISLGQPVLGTLAALAGDALLRPLPIFKAVKPLLQLLDQAQRYGLAATRFQADEVRAGDVVRAMAGQVRRLLEASPERERLCVLLAPLASVCRHVKEALAGAVAEGRVRLTPALARELPKALAEDFAAALRS